MKFKKVSLEELMNSYRESLGMVGAEKLIRQTLFRAGLPYQAEYSKEEALKICRELKQYQGTIGVVGVILHSRITIR